MPTAAEMPRYQCHKQVHALKVANVYVTGEGVDEHIELSFLDSGYAPIRPSAEWIDKNLRGKEPTSLIRGYYVVYSGGYASWSPEKEFDDGYTRI